MGAPSKPIRLMVSLLILKYIRNLSDENLVEQWSENCYYQYLSGEQTFKPKIPCVPTELVAFRKRIGEAGVELILKESIRINKIDADPPDNNTVVSLVRPGLTDPASIAYRDESKLLARAADPERVYVEQVMPAKLRCAAQYVDQMSLLGDLRLIGATLRALWAR